MKKKLTLIIAMAAVAMAALTGCCKHEWTEATCEAPRTCSLCGKTEGEVVDHTWTEATCEAPKTCSVCGTTEGEPLGHKFSEAGYLTPAVCSVCGATGETKQSYFAEKGLNIVDAIPETLEGPYLVYTLADRLDFICRTNPATLNVDSASNGDGTKTIVAEYIVPLTCEYQYNTGKEYYAATMDCGLYDFYTGQGIFEEPTDGDAFQEISLNVNIDGKEVAITGEVSITWETGEWYAANEETECIDLLCDKVYIITVPEDYDGLVFGVKNFVKNTTEEEEAAPKSKDPFYADYTGDFGTKEQNGTFVRIGW